MQEEPVNYETPYEKKKSEYIAQNPMIKSHLEMMLGMQLLQNG